MQAVISIHKYFYTAKRIETADWKIAAYSVWETSSLQADDCCQTIQAEGQIIREKYIATKNPWWCTVNSKPHSGNTIQNFEQNW